MGGFGTGKWQRRGSKKLVEDSVIISTADFGRKLNLSKKGILEESTLFDQRLSIHFQFDGSGGQNLLLMHYAWLGIVPVRLEVEITTSPVYFGGTRYWFVCPSIKGKPECDRRVKKLYLPYSSMVFACRHCHRLTYESCQRAHKGERIPKWLRAKLLEWGRPASVVSG